MNSRRIASFACPTQFCSGGNAPGAQKQEEEVEPQAEMSILQARMKARYNEPLKPLSIRQNAVAAVCASVLERIGNLVDRNKPDTQSRDPRVLLDQRIPLTQLVNVHGMDITELINGEATPDLRVVFAPERPEPLDDEPQSRRRR
jgi:hypothetical protein